MKKIYIIPWYKHDENTLGYKELQNSLVKNGYIVVIINISWKYNVMSNYIKQAELQIEDTENAEILGFSFGAMITLKLAEQYKFKRVFLCSLSPYFSEDLHLFPKYYSFKLWLRRWNDFRDHYKGTDIRNSYKNKILMIYGWKETDRLQKRAKKMVELLGIKDVSIVEQVWHDIADKKYLEAIIWLV